MIIYNDHIVYSILIKNWQLIAIIKKLVKLCYGKISKSIKKVIQKITINNIIYIKFQ